MKKKRFSVEQIAAVLQQAEGGVPVGDVCRQVGISEQTYYRWKKVYAGMPPPRRATTSGAWTSWPTNWPMAGAFAR